MVILDMIMPGMSGGETFDHLKELNPEIKVILSSGYSPDGIASQIMEHGCRSFMKEAGIPRSVNGDEWQFLFMFTKVAGLS
jgi:CheY-like chemotaxis protein